MSDNENLMPKLEQAFPDRIDRNQAILTTRIIVLEALAELLLAKFIEQKGDDVLKEKILEQININLVSNVVSTSSSLAQLRVKIIDERLACAHQASQGGE